MTRQPEAQASVAIIGAGFGGLCMAIQLALQGHRRFTIFEAAGALGGTWRDNTYPGAACDVPSHLYCFSFAQKRDWTRKFAGQAEILEYLESVADKFGIRPKIRFNARVVELDWQEQRGQWDVALASGERMAFDVVVSAVGQLHKPKIPHIVGTESFENEQFHSARWNHSVPLANKDVVVIGSGASAIQFVPPVVEAAKSVTIMQRSANYVAPRNDRVYSHRALAAFRRLPALATARRLQIWAVLESKFIILRKNGWVGSWFTKKYADGVASMEKVGLSRDAVVPDYPPGCKRLLISDNWFQALARSHVSVVTDPIDAIQPTGVSAGGVTHPADVIIWGTGFETNDFLAPMRVSGSNGTDLNTTWKDGAEAYLGLCVAGFPNLFLLYGPNTNLGHNSIVFMIEQQVEFILRVLGRMSRSEANTVEVKPDTMRSFNIALQSRLDNTVWSTDCDSWYKTASGKITNNWSGLTSSYRATLRRSDLTEFTYGQRSQRATTS